MIFVIYGEESFLMEQKLQALKKEYNCSEEMMNLSTYRGDEDSIESVYEDLITPPFFTAPAAGRVWCIFCGSKRAVCAL